jgi:hypothetical protein
MKKKEKNKKVEQKNLKKKEKKRKKKKRKSKKKKGRRITVDSCCNPQCFVCGGTVNPPHGLVICI